MIATTKSDLNCFVEKIARGAAIRSREAGGWNSVKKTINTFLV